MFLAFNGTSLAARADPPLPGRALLEQVSQAFDHDPRLAGFKRVHLVKQAHLPEERLSPEATAFLDAELAAGQLSTINLIRGYSVAAENAFQELPALSTRYQVESACIGGQLRHRRTVLKTFDEAMQSTMGFISFSAEGRASMAFSIHRPGAQYPVPPETVRLFIGVDQARATDAMTGLLARCAPAAGEADPAVANAFEGSPSERKHPLTKLGGLYPDVYGDDWLRSVKGNDGWMQIKVFDGPNKAVDAARRFDRVVARQAAQGRPAIGAKEESIELGGGTRIKRAGTWQYAYRDG
jgi:hypothetical protein